MKDMRWLLEHGFQSLAKNVTSCIAFEKVGQDWIIIGEWSMPDDQWQWVAAADKSSDADTSPPMVQLSSVLVYATVEGWT